MRINLDHRLLTSQHGQTLANLSLLLLGLNGTPHRLEVDGAEDGTKAWDTWISGEPRPRDATHASRHHEQIPPAYDPFREDEALRDGIDSSIKKFYPGNLARRRDGKRRVWCEEQWLAEDDEIRDELIRIISSIERRL